ncbi:uncharacterized protein STEHIDRAFT_126337 [Stereum hirsutum FP-91666 SS1]|uniref:Uncharacterized protein n=1 Tax=Stereum hirsutum (strain FP-91666) TaxID=721885 RepID=R7RWG0_STEHR|nr:uncharacterized protein STEHIDRAFT_126337 [Stereum hirsutum FP-91666 SS1]EIM79644.1 hypothetical protein STEHIDRAFT_126337 [Stereum hirsutum FP-91666 SS1]
MALKLKKEGDVGHYQAVRQCVAVKTRMAVKRTIVFLLEAVAHCVFYQGTTTSTLAQPAQPEHTYSDQLSNLRGDMF